MQPVQPGVLRRVSARGYCCVLAVAMLVSLPVPAVLSPPHTSRPRVLARGAWTCLGAGCRLRCVAA
jgi:hypothetical protein